MLDARWRWAVALGGALVAAIIVGLWIYFDHQNDVCREWQARYRVLSRENRDGVFDYINIGPLATMRDERPEGCEVPH